MQAPVIDTHCHIDLVIEAGISEETAVSEAGAAGVEAWIQIATGLKSARFNADFADRRNAARGNKIPAQAAGDEADRSASRATGASNPGPAVYWTAGMHPEAADDLSELDELLQFVRDSRERDDFVAIGETGLDYFHTKEFVENQKLSLDRHFALAKELGLPVVLHLRDDRVYDPANIQTVHDALEILDRHPGVVGVLHCYTYTEAEAQAFVDRGWFVSYSGILTFKNAKTIQQGAIRLPLECLMVETDAPFLAPLPHRGKTNQPGYVRHTLEFLARLRAEHCGEDPDTVKSTVLANSKRFIEQKHLLKRGAGG
ncbi:MAG: TatD family hydrolase [bacterium]|nr:TatD family hydrolase [bacterium]